MSCVSAKDVFTHDYFETVVVLEVTENLVLILQGTKIKKYPFNTAGFYRTWETAGWIRVE